MTATPCTLRGPLDAVMPGGCQIVHAHGQLKIRAGAIAWVAGAVQYLTAQLVAQSAWRTPYSWMINPLSDLGAVGCQRTGTGYRCRATSVRRCTGS